MHYWRFRSNLDKPLDNQPLSHGQTFPCLGRTVTIGPKWSTARTSVDGTLLTTVTTEIIEDTEISVKQYWYVDNFALFCSAKPFAIMEKKIQGVRTHW